MKKRNSYSGLDTWCGESSYIYRSYKEEFDGNDGQIKYDQSKDTSLWNRRSWSETDKCSLWNRSFV